MHQLPVYKVYSEHCQTCLETEVFDRSVIEGLGLELIYVDIDDVKDYPDLYQAILKEYGEDYPVPLYVQDSDRIIEGGMSKVLFKIYSKETFDYPFVMVDGFKVAEPRVS